MKAELEQLVALQNVDTGIRRLQSDLESIPRRRAEIESEFDQRAFEFRALQQTGETARETRAQLERELAEQRTRMEKAERDLMASNNAKVYEAAIRERDAAKKHISELETKVLEQMEAAESAEKQLAEREPEFARLSRVALPANSPAAMFCWIAASALAMPLENPLARPPCAGLKSFRLKADRASTRPSSSPSSRGARAGLTLPFTNSGPRRGGQKKGRAARVPTLARFGARLSRPRRSSGAAAWRAGSRVCGCSCRRGLSLRRGESRPSPAASAP